MIENAERICHAVTILNDNIYENSSLIVKHFIERHGNMIEFHSDGNEGVVKFLGFTVWSSADEERRFDEQTNEYEPIEEFLFARICHVKSVIDSAIVNNIIVNEQA